MSDKKTRPGVMLYYDCIRPALKRLDDSQCGVLLRAIIDYAEYGVILELDPMTGMAFDMLIPKLDRDAEKYEESREQRQYAVYVREKQKAGEPYMKITEWRLSRYKAPDIGPISPDNGSVGPYPSTTPSVSPSISVTPSPAAFTAGEVTGEGFKGEGEGEPEQQYARWLELMDAGDRQAAFAVSNELFKMGFNVDPVTKKLSKRL